MSQEGHLLSHLLIFWKTDLGEWTPKESKWSTIGPDSSSLSGIQIITRLQCTLSNTIIKSNVW